MSRYEDIVTCDGCGVEITWAPFHPPGAPSGCDYCCKECFEGVLARQTPPVCGCSERMELEDAPRSREIAAW
jgi:hypothetical protein